MFGSTAGGKATAESDLDVAVAAEAALAPEARLGALEAPSPATSREVDLIDLLAETGPILKQALSKGIIVRSNDKPSYARLISRRLFAEADMMPNYNRILRERRERFVNG